MFLVCVKVHNLKKNILLINIRKHKIKPLSKSHSLKEISDLSGYELKGLKTIFEKGQGAFFSNPQSVRPQIKALGKGGADAWAYARVYASINPLGQFLGAIIMFGVLGMLPGYVLAKILNGMGKLRIPREVEIAGLDYEMMEDDRDAEKAVASSTR